MGYSEEEYLQLSGIQHFAFCRRQWALAYIELQWQENLRTVEGKLLHEKAHDGYIAEKRKDVIISRGMPIFSREMGVTGTCDIVELHKDSNGVSIYGRDGLYLPVPVEYKRGKPKESDEDAVQMVAQAMCLEEMFCCKVEYGYIFYGETKHRIKVFIDNKIRDRVKVLFKEMHEMFSRRHTPGAKTGKHCRACSLADFCLPGLCKGKSAKHYIRMHIMEDTF